MRSLRTPIFKIQLNAALFFGLASNKVGFLVASELEFGIRPEDMPNFSLPNIGLLDLGRMYPQIVILRCDSLSLSFGVYCKGTDKSDDAFGVAIFAQSPVERFGAFFTVPL